MRSNRMGWALLTPTLVILTIVGVLPFLYVLYIGFFNWNAFSNQLGMQWAGVDNYRRLVFDAAFLDSLARTGLFAFVAVTVELFVPSAADQDGNGVLDECQCATLFVRGEVNGDSNVNLADVIYLLNYTFGSGAAPIPILEAGDVNDDASYDVGDSVYLLDFFFIGGPPPPAPFPSPGCG